MKREACHRGGKYHGLFQDANPYRENDNLVVEPNERTRRRGGNDDHPHVKVRFLCRKTLARKGSFSEGRVPGSAKEGFRREGKGRVWMFERPAIYLREERELGEARVKEGGEEKGSRNLCKFY